MFLYNLRYRWSTPENAAPHGIILNASGVDVERAQHREPREGLPDFVLFDPQLYLVGLDVEASPQSCARLASYPFFPIDVPEFRSSEQSRQDWMSQVEQIVSDRWPIALPTDLTGIRQIIRSALEFQVRVGASHLILPVPAIESADTPLDLTMQWVDLGHEEFLRIASRATSGALPFVSLTVSENLLQGSIPSENPILQGIIDHLTSRDEAQGIYLVIEKAPDAHERITSTNVAWSILYMSHVFSIVRRLVVFINFTEQLGLFALAAGAKGFGSGYETKGQRCCLLDYAERAGGRALPHFYSLATLCDFFPERDLLLKIAPARLLRLFDDDEQPASANLFSALRSGAESRRLPPDWAETINNVRAAQAHYIQRVRSATEELSGLSTQHEKVERALMWMQRAEQNTTYLASRFETDPLSDLGMHTGAWRQAFENYASEFNLI